jgi:hypothetical protein
MNGNGSRVLPPDGMYHTDLNNGLESGMTDKVGHLFRGQPYRCMKHFAT